MLPSHGLNEIALRCFAKPGNGLSGDFDAFHFAVRGFSDAPDKLFGNVRTRFIGRDIPGATATDLIKKTVGIIGTPRLEAFCMNFSN